MDPLTFATALLSRGIELVPRNHGRRLAVWPSRAYRVGLSDAERSYLREHRAALLDIATAKRLPESTVVWREHNSGTDAPVAASPRLSDAGLCAYCGGRPCVGPENPWYRIYHWTAPDQQAKRDAVATAVMMRQVGRS